jgi:three-Cys-motif partner protein
MLSEYAVRYSMVMNGRKREWLQAYYYIDAFAGPGIALHKGDQRVSSFLQGSPMRVLQIEPRFDYCWFIDKNPRRADVLNRILSETNTDDSRYRIEVGEANAKISNLVGNLNSQERALVFLDPYGLQVEWRTVEALAASRRVDVLINFSLMGILRNLRRVRGPSIQFRQLMAKVLRSTDWIEEVYAQQATLEGDTVDVRGEIGSAELAEHYQADLKKVFASVSEPAIMTNSRGGAIYALIFASQNTGAAKRIMDGVVRKYTRERTRRRPTPPQKDQPQLWESDPI